MESVNIIPSVDAIKDVLMHQREENPTNWYINKYQSSDCTEVSVECFVPQVDAYNYLEVVSGALLLVFWAQNASEFSEDKIYVQFMKTQPYSTTFDVIFTFEI